MEEKTKKILFVEDDSALTDIYNLVFEKGGFEADIAQSGAEALKKLKEAEAGKSRKPDMVILDLILPDINGMEVLSEIRKMKESGAVPVFVLSNQSREEFEKIGGAKPDDFIIKANVTPAQILEKVNNWFKK